jgi:hypothetical protein
MFGKHTFSLKARLVGSEAQVQPSLVGSKDISMVVFFFFSKEKEKYGLDSAIQVGIGPTQTTWSLT